MTSTEILDDSKRHVLNTWVAEYVLGWRWLVDPWSKSLRRYLAPPSDHKFGTPAKGDEPARHEDSPNYMWTHDIGHAWPVVEAVRRWPPTRQLQFLSGLAMQHDGSDDPLAWLIFVCREPALAICRAALLASIDASRGHSSASPPTRHARSSDKTPG